MSRVLLLNPPGRQPYIRDNYCSYSAKANYFWEPIDLLGQSAHLSGKFELTVIDAIALGLSPDQVLKRANELKPAAVLSLTGSVSLDQDRVLFERLKNNTGAKIAVSGDICLTAPERVFELLPAVDAVLTDYTTPDFTEYLSGDQQPGRTFGTLAHRHGEQVIGIDPDKSPPEQIDLPLPRHDLFPIDRYRISTSIDRKFATSISSFGCNFNCPFCICSVMQLRLRSIDSLLAELRSVRQSGIREIYFYDPHFTVKRSRCIEMLDAIIKADLNIIFSANSHITVSEEVLDKMAKAGCHTMMFGIETADEQALARYSKGITQERVRRTLKACRERGIRTFGYFLIGLPGETEKSVRETIQFARDLPLHYASFNLPSPVEGTGLYEEVCSEGRLSTTDKNLDRSSQVSIRLDDISHKRLLELKTLAYRRFYLRPLFLLQTLITLYPRKKWGYFLKDAWTFFRRNFL
jgi:radical SAM superfamily enzyme YgiQ (UPF0313 family)